MRRSPAMVEQWLELRGETLSLTTYEAHLGKARFRLVPGLGSIALRKLTVLSRAGSVDTVKDR
jgi:hypothetical protein